MIREILHILKKDFSLEWRRLESIGGLIIYMLAIIFIIYLVFRQISVQLWNVLYWLIVLFAGLQLGVRSFEEESGGRKYYYYQLASAESYFIAKIIYNFLLILLFEVLCYAGLWVVSGVTIVSAGVFIATNVLSAIGLSAIFTFTSGAAAGMRNNGTLISVMTLPLIIPVILQAVTLNTISTGLITDTAVTGDFMLFGAIDLVLLSIGLGLFPYLWQE